MCVYKPNIILLNASLVWPPFAGDSERSQCMTIGPSVCVWQLRRSVTL